MVTSRKKEKCHNLPLISLGLIYLRKGFRRPYKRWGLYPRGIINGGVISEGDYKRRGLYPTGIINEGAYIRGGL